jgi:phosphatidate cytidylyltransferase
MTSTRIIAALVMAPLAIAAILLLPTPWLVALVALVFLMGMWEWFKLAEIDDTLSRTILLVANLVLMVLLVWASAGSMVLFQIVTLIGAAWWCAALLWLRFFNFASDHETYARVFKLAAGTLAILPAWCALGLIHASGGRWFGSRKLAPRISPNKTLEGLLGGLAAGVLAGLGFAWLAGLTLPQVPAFVLVAIAAVLFSVVGDLFESLLKRHVGAKDSGNMIPGHGGILDRLDGVLAALPIFAVGKELFGF